MVRSHIPCGLQCFRPTSTTYPYLHHLSGLPSEGRGHRFDSRNEATTDARSAPRRGDERSEESILSGASLTLAARLAHDQLTR
jgi:hypothetical protein